MASMESSVAATEGDEAAPEQPVVEEEAETVNTSAGEEPDEKDEVDTAPPRIEGVEGDEDEAEKVDAAPQCEEGENEQELVATTGEGEGEKSDVVVEENGHDEDANEAADVDKSTAAAAPAAVDDSDDEEFAGFGEEEINANKALASSSSKKRPIVSDDEDESGSKEADGSKEDEEAAEEDDDDDGVVEGINEKKKKKKHKRDHHHKHHHKHHKKKEREHKKRRSSEGGSDDESGDEKEGGEEEDVDPEKIDEEIHAGQEGAAAAAQSEDDDVSNEASDNEGKKKIKETSDLEFVLNKQKEENRRRNRRKKGDSEELNDMDGFISHFINEMKSVANEDRVANEKSQTAVQKLKMLPDVINLLQKSDYHAAMIECGILGGVAEWLAPLPDRSLPNIKIREAFIEALREFGEINTDYLKSSGIGKAVMFLYKHSKETKQNKLKLEKLIHNWSRPIFNLDASAKQLTKEDRMNRDIEHVKSNRRNSSDGNLSQSVNEDFDRMNASDRYKSKKARNSNDEASDSDNEPNKILRPGDPGFCPRARVPMPSVKDYVIRPKSSTDTMEMAEKKVKKAVSRIEKHKRRFTEMKRVSKFQRAVNMSVSGKF